MTEKNINEQTINALEDIREQHYKVMDSINTKKGLASNASLYARSREVFDRIIDLLDYMHHGDEPKEISNGSWQKWTSRTTYIREG